MPSWRARIRNIEGSSGRIICTKLQTLKVDCSHQSAVINVRAHISNFLRLPTPRPQPTTSLRADGADRAGALAGAAEGFVGGLTVEW